MTKVRPARIEDADRVAFVHVESWKTTYAGIVPETYLASLTYAARSEGWRKQFEGGSNLIFVSEDETGVFGFVSGGPLRDSIPGYDAELYAIYLLQQKQRQGVGRALVRELAKALDAKGYRSLIVWVLEKNPFLEFYYRMGGAPVLTKEIEIGGVRLTEVALGWQNISDLH